MVQQAWSFKAIEKGDLRYWGNDGYHDDSSTFYRYDSSVPNHKQVKVGDIVIVTNRDKVLGISVINTITTRDISKKRNKCAHLECDAKKIHYRKTLTPRWRCDNGHEFNSPREVFHPAKEFIAKYDSQYQGIADIPMAKLTTETLRPNGQLSIQEVNLHWAAQLLESPSTFTFSLGAVDADDTPNLVDGDQRDIVSRQIRQRRGQKKFRDELLKSNPVCAVTGCELIDILEAAHIEAYRNESHNHISNGVLLRSDIHTLFDLNLCAIDPRTNKVHFSEGPLRCGYQKFEGAVLFLKHKISFDALSKRWKIFTR